MVLVIVVVQVGSPVEMCGVRLFSFPFLFLLFDGGQERPVDLTARKMAKMEGKKQS